MAKNRPSGARRAAPPAPRRHGASVGNARRRTRHASDQSGKAQWARECDQSGKAQWARDSRALAPRPAAVIRARGLISIDRNCAPDRQRPENCRCQNFCLTRYSLAPSFLRFAAASRYSGDSWQATAFSKLGNSMTMRRWNFSGPSRILNLPPRARILPSNFWRMPGTRSVLLVLIGIVDLRARDPIGDHLILHAKRERPC